MKEHNTTSDLSRIIHKELNVLFLPEKVKRVLDSYKIPYQKRGKHNLVNKKHIEDILYIVALINGGHYTKKGMLHKYQQFKTTKHGK